MKTTIDNNEAVFMVKYSDSYTSHIFFCNLKDIPEVIKQAGHEDGGQHPYTIYNVTHFTGIAPIKQTKKYINEMLKDEGIDFILP